MSSPFSNDVDDADDDDDDDDDDRMSVRFVAPSDWYGWYTGTAPIAILVLVPREVSSRSGTGSCDDVMDDGDDGDDFRDDGDDVCPCC